jgi:dienelactone hydrolase
MPQDIEFDAEGATLRGWLYLPEGISGPVPAIVMAHGFSAVKEMYLDAFAEAFTEGGLGVLVFDNRNFGASDGEPRQEIDPARRCATTATRSPTPRRAPRSTPSGSGCGGPATAAAMCWCSGRSTSASSASSPRSRWSAASATSSDWFARTSWRPTGRPSRRTAPPATGGPASNGAGGRPRSLGGLGSAHP